VIVTKNMTDVIADVAVREILEMVVKEIVKTLFSGGMNLIVKSVAKLGVENVTKILVTDVAAKDLLIELTPVFADLEVGNHLLDKKLFEKTVKEAIMNEAYKQAEQWYLKSKHDQIAAAAKKGAIDKVGEIMKMDAWDWIPIVGDVKLALEVKEVVSGDAVKSAGQTAARNKAIELMDNWPQKDMAAQTVKMAKPIVSKMKKLRQEYQAGKITTEEYYKELNSYLKQLGYDDSKTKSKL